MHRPHVVVTGGSGFVGSALLPHLRAKGYESVVLSRDLRPVPGADRTSQWDGKSVGVWAREVDGAAGVIHLAGASVAKRWTPEYKKLILSSRVDSTRAIAEAISKSHHPPPAWVNASGLGGYGDTGETFPTEDHPLADTFLGEVCREWEGAMHAFPTPQTRKVALRIGIVLGNGGGALGPLANLTKAFLGGAAGSGRQWMSWIHLKDLVNMMVWAIENPVEGPFNAVAPKPVRNAEFMATLRKVLHRPWSPPAPKFAMKLGSALMGVEADLVLMNQAASAQKLLDAGFQFEFDDLEKALRDLLAK